MTHELRRVRAVARKELREYRRQRSGRPDDSDLPAHLSRSSRCSSSSSCPASRRAPSSSGTCSCTCSPSRCSTPTILAAYVGGRRAPAGQPRAGLTTPVAREEFLRRQGPCRARAIGRGRVCRLRLLPRMRRPVRQPDVASAILRVPDLVAQLSPDAPARRWSIWVGIAISVRSSDVRVAQQLSLLANLPLILLTSLPRLCTIRPTPALAIGLTSLLLVADALGWRIVAPDVRPRAADHGRELM